MMAVRSRAPGRVNLIGEHTDYNDGFVLPIAIDLATTIDAVATADRTLAVTSEAMNDRRTFDLDALPDGPTGDWSDYVRGVVVELQREGYSLGGARLRIASDLPLGGGLSSSASLEIATGLAMTALAGQTIDRLALALVAQRAENRQVGARTGIMDQFVSANGRAGHALLLDTRSLTAQFLPIPADARIVVCNTMVKHHLSSGEYNDRRAACERGVAAIADRFPTVRALRDATMEQLDAIRDRIDGVTYRRCRHVITEDERVLRAADALRAGDVTRFGELMNASHESLRDDYQVSCAELDRMVELARATEGCYGARMTGGGFGGCTVNLVRAPDAQAFARTIRARFADAVGVMPDVFATSAADGACVCEVAST
jgi:galactokinase